MAEGGWVSESDSRRVSAAESIFTRGYYCSTYSVLTIWDPQGGAGDLLPYGKGEPCNCPLTIKH